MKHEIRLNDRYVTFLIESVSRVEWIQKSLRSTTLIHFKDGNVLKVEDKNLTKFKESHLSKIQETTLTVYHAITEKMAKSA